MIDMCSRQVVVIPCLDSVISCNMFCYTVRLIIVVTIHRRHMFLVAVKPKMDFQKLCYEQVLVMVHCRSV